MTAKKESPKRFLVTVVGTDHWNPEVRQWLERPAGTSADQVLAEFRKKYPPPFTVVVMPEREQTTASG